MQMYPISSSQNLLYILFNAHLLQCPRTYKLHREHLNTHQPIVTSTVKVGPKISILPVHVLGQLLHFSGSHMWDFIDSWTRDRCVIGFRPRSSDVVRNLCVFVKSNAQRCGNPIVLFLRGLERTTPLILGLNPITHL